jgi:hypothetical protein
MLISHCLQQGTERAQQAKGMNVVFVIGNTGAGKSTFINYLCGCEMVEKKRKDLGMKGGGKVIVVVGSAVATIGHETQKSATFLPVIAYDEKTNTVYCDCPGFLDNRGAEINIANAVNIRAMIAIAKSVRIAVLINHHSILGDRARGLQDMMRILATMFHTDASMQEHQASVLLGATRYPRDQELDDLRDEITDGPCGDAEVTKQLVARLFIYDALDRPFGEDSGLKRDALLAEIKGMPAITGATNIFKMVLTAEDDLELTKLCSAVSESTKDHLELKEWDKAAETAKRLLQLKPIDHPSVDRQLQQSQLCFERHFNQLKSECQDTISDENFEGVGQMIEELEAAMDAFEAAGLQSEQDQKANVEALRKQLDHRKQLVKARKEKELQRAKELQAARNDTKKMAQLYQAGKKQRKIDMQEAAERLKREQEERRQEVAEFKKQMKGLQANALYRT